jgi:nitrite reductase/ring-hydroxylating ferredoxin subunit/uncharacterized membrane protein
MRLSRVTDWLEAQDALDRVGEPLNRAVRRVIRAGPVKDALSGTWLGHPVHPVSVMVPIGSWTSATLIDLSARGRSTVAARRLVGIGLLTALPSALSGLADWSDTAGAEQRIGVSHAALNSFAVALFGASWWARRRPGPTGMVLALAGMAVATGSGYLGGHMIYAQGVGVDTNSFHSGPDEWETVAAVRDLHDGEGIAVAAGRTRLLLVLQGGDVKALENRCSHRGGPLSDGVVKDDCVVCPWHDSRFDLSTGEVVAGPATVGQAPYEVRVNAGQVQVRRNEIRALRTSPD